MYSVYQHWDPLKVCVVGRTWPPEFYSWITVPRVRSLFERIAQETEEDLNNIVKVLESFNVEVLRPELPEQKQSQNGRFYPPPQTPRDYFGMIGTRLYNNFGYHSIWSTDAPNKIKFYNDIRDETWPDVQSQKDYDNLPKKILHEVEFRYSTEACRDTSLKCYSAIMDKVKAQGNSVRVGINSMFTTAMIARIGKDLFHGTLDYHLDQTEPRRSEFFKKYQMVADREFPEFRNHIVDTQGHLDGMYCPVCPGLIVSLHDFKTYENTYPGWEVVYLPNQSWSAVKEFLELKSKNQGRWWIPGWEKDQDVCEVVETWLGHWTGYVEETVFDVNMLIIDPKNVIVFNHNDIVFEALARYGITPHVVPMRHRYFWDGGIHCVTSDLHREGEMRDFFPHLSQSIKD